jgi:hypothetical protein
LFFVGGTGGGQAGGVEVVTGGGGSSAGGGSGGGAPAAAVVERLGDGDGDVAGEPAAAVVVEPLDGLPVDEVPVGRGAPVGRGCSDARPAGPDCRSWVATIGGSTAGIRPVGGRPKPDSSSHIDAAVTRAARAGPT